MRKIATISIIANVLLLVSVTVLFKKYSSIKNKNVSKKKVIVVKNENIDSVIYKTDPIYIFKSQKFPCDSGYASYETNICMGEKLHFADNLLNKLVVYNLKEFDYRINQDKDGVLKAEENSYFVKSLKSAIASKENFIKTQKKWEELRTLKSESVRLGCEGGTGCSGIVSSAEIKEVLKRMQEIK
ncbi:hypothetical protein [Flavobacterium aquidurense]|uniref:hypothetical protein n=1 Tax=Flavobacterium aquidurense TaxID=362413 RepID=UPI002862A09F|nr:hypothetical protein [Flavobacterium aquidurense]MDR7370777.1 uncharacterized protein YecT (DUF1311 family) [Flavobacterium aquidurense]